MSHSPDHQPSPASQILVADDDPLILLVMKTILEKSGYGVDTVNDGEKAVQALALKRYNLVLMDCNMPKMNGWAATRLIRSGRSGALDPGIPIIAFTGLKSKQDLAQCLDAGMNSHVGKPPQASTLITSIEKYLKP